MSYIKKKSSFTSGIIGFAAAVVLFASGAFGTMAYRANTQVVSVVSLDVNPSISIDINCKEKVLEVTPLNDEGVIIIGDMDFKGSNLDVVVNALLGYMLRNGYLNDIANSILVSVDGADPSKSEELKQRLSAEIEQLLTNQSFSGSVLSQTISKDDSLRAKAVSHNISVGKAQLVEEIAAGDIRYEFEDIYNLSINELNLIKGSSTELVTAVQSSGTASDKGYIGEAAAKSIALQAAGASPSEISRYYCEYDWEHGTMVYEVEFVYTGLEYEYEINATTGEIAKASRERDDDAKKYNQQSQQTHPVQNEHHDDQHDNHGNQPVQTTQPNQPINDIGRDKALSIALNHAGVASADAWDIEIELDDEHGTLIYEVEFKSNGMEYSYEINALDGTITKSY